MFEWKVEDLMLLNDKVIEVENGEYIFSVEPNITKKDKIDFVDKLNDGILSYIINLMEKFDKIKDGMMREPEPFEEYYDQKSLDNWLKENDKKKVIRDIGRVKFYWSERFINRDLLNSKGDYDIYDDIVDEYFHQTLRICYVKEKEYSEKLSMN